MALMIADIQPLLRMAGITKRFGSVTVLDDVSFELRRGEVHVLAGENGAGKSTLIKILAGVYQPTRGSMVLDKRPFAPRNPLEGERHGVAVIHQELSLVRPMSIADNVFLGRENTRAGWVDYPAQEREARRVLGEVGLDLDVARAVEAYPIGVQQMIEIGKALGRNAKIIVMDEPTSALNAREAEHLFALVGELKEKGCAIVYITHKMEEIECLADRITVLRDGRHIGTAPRSELSMPELIEWMVGRKVDRRFPRHAPHPGDELLSVENFSVFPNGKAAKPAVAGVSFCVRAGEIVGIGGLQGSGGTELMTGLFGGYGGRKAGAVRFKGHPVSFRAPGHAIESGMAYVTNDRKASGLVPGNTIVFNTTLADLKRLTPAGWRVAGRETAATREATKPLQLRAASLDMPVRELSGGNQQKVVIAKWLRTDPCFLLLDEPTRGIDVGAKREIYALLNAWTARGMGILLITSEMPELLAMSDRIIVLHRGRLIRELAAQEATAEKVLAAAMGEGGEEVPTDLGPTGRREVEVSKA